jgi:hypothetical protein
MKFQTQSVKGLLATAVKPRTKYRFHMATILLFYITNNEFNKSCIAFVYQTKFHSSTLNGTPATQIS